MGALKASGNKEILPREDKKSEKRSGIVCVIKNNSVTLNQ